ncbi:zinc finger CCCH domain-containing protein 14 isoform X3 [Nilaparvata lugens]|uniref:zinc finger CCCH domain-containing protein 14 isoform X3 n=1 Tax=Nilaparvata lugens TaxID=108931 RepID=UPI00193CB285|nr:zinc finger CCCH domain-containing protein 14 isoform X3 [Nilaparvata lugens]
MDCLGKEVTHKMKSAIMAKLMELGIKADMDLLEYIMLMISNKRTKAGMTRDLSLFLGSSTVPFVTWLHQVLSKLQEVTISTQVSQPKQVKTENVPSEKVHESAEAKLADNVKCKKRERTPSAEEHEYLNIRADIEADPIDDLQSVIDEGSSKITPPTKPPTEKKEPDRSISSKHDSSKIKDSQSSKASSSLEKQKSSEEQSRDESGTKRRRISPPAKEREKELRDESDTKKRRVSPPPSKGRERESSRDNSELRRKRLSSPLLKEREREVTKDDNEIKKKRISSPVKDDGEIRRVRLLSPAKDKESLKDEGALRKRRLSPVEKDRRIKDVDKRLGSESGRREKAVFDVRELLNKRKAEKSAVTDERRSRETERRHRSPPPTKRPASERERTMERERDRERMRERVRERDNEKRSESRELSSDRRRPPSKVVRVESLVHDVSDARSGGRSNFADRDRSRSGERERSREREKAVPSVVKVTPRPVRPPNQQPSSCLILKAMAEANKSLAKQGGAAASATVVAEDDASGGCKKKTRMRKSSAKDADETDFKRSQLSFSLSSLSSVDDVHLELHHEEGSDEEEEEERNAKISHGMAAKAFKVAFKYARQQNASDDELCVLEKWMKYCSKKS